MEQHELEEFYGEEEEIKESIASNAITPRSIIEMFERSNFDQYQILGGLPAFETEFDTDCMNGLGERDKNTGYRKRILRFGRNVLPEPPRKSWCRMFWEAFQNLTLEILVVAAFVSLILVIAFPAEHIPGETSSRWLDFIDPLSIFAAVIIVAFVQAQTNYVQQKSFIEINKLKNEFHVNVIRNGEEMQILNSELYVGDVLSLKNGDRVAADGLYISGHSLKIDTSQETGESVAVNVNERQPFVLGGSAVESGDAHVLVCAVGEKSQSGVNMMKIQEMTQAHDQSPLERKLDKIAIQLTWMGLGSALLTFIVLLVIWVLDVIKVKWSNAYLNKLVEQLMVGVTIFICAVPEGLPLATTLSLGFSMKWMVNDNIFVRHLNSCETMGGATTICSDKTGTLTQNNMTVVRFYMNNDESDGFDTIVQPMKDLLAEAISVNTSAYQNIDESGNPGKYIGQSSECALLQMIDSHFRSDYRKTREQYPIAILHEFNSTRKRMSTIIHKDDAWRIYAKGAPDFMLERCTRYMTDKGEYGELDEDKKNAILDKVIEYADQALRTILIAYADLEGFECNESWYDPDTVECNLTMIGIAGIMDPLRPEVKDAIVSCKKAGVMVRMVTGDYINTAKAISRECGILTDDGTAMIGYDFSSMSKLDLLPLLPKLQVLARSSPRDKYRLVGLLMEAGEVVAVTGDGSNDSAALKRANVGLAMGKCGTELAKMASDIVILDDNFSSIVVALKWGRCVYDNVRGFLQYQLTVNFSAMFIAFVGSCYLKTSPLKAIQLLWTNLIVGAIGALALATNRPTNALLDRQPYGESDPIISNIMWRNIIGQLIYQIIVIFIILFGFDTVFKFEENHNQIIRTTMVFNCFVYCQIINLINARIAGPNMKVLDGILKNPYFDIIFIFLCALQAVIVQFAGRAFVTAPLTWQQWTVCVCLAIGTIFVGIISRCIKLPDKTLERLIATRNMKKNEMQLKYEGLSASEQWDVEYTPENIKKVDLGTSTPAP